MTSDETQLLKRSLMCWSLSEPLPEGIADRLPIALQDAQAMLVPAADKEVAIAMDQLFTQLPMPSKAALTQWRRVMQQYPMDLLVTAVEELIKTYCWDKPPKIADLVRVINYEFRQRNDWRRKIETAQLKARMTRRSAPSPAATHQPRRLPEDIKAKLRAMYAEAGISAQDLAAEEKRAATIDRAGGNE